MAYAFFDGENIFGVAVQMVTVINPVARQQNTYPGLSGVEELIQGRRGAVTQVSGRIYGDSVGALNGVKQLWYSYYDGRGYTLFDTGGQLWTNVKLERFQPIPPVQFDQGIGSWSQRYEATFFHASA